MSARSADDTGPDDMQRLRGKTALVTGGSSGIGLATARLFVDHGARVAITGREASSLDDGARALGQDTLAVESDAGKLDDIDRLMDTVKARWGRLDVLLVNAAVARPAPFEQVTEQQFDLMSDVNFKGAFFTVQKALPLLSPGASIILVTSIANRMGSPNFSVYAAFKAAMRSLAQTLALELAPRRIRVNAISPGPIETPIWDKFGLPAADVETVKADIERRSPARRFGQADEIARAALFLACDDSSYVIGHEIVVDGGMSLR